jgi:hypothetical protein
MDKASIMREIVINGETKKFAVIYVNTINGATLGIVVDTFDSVVDANREAVQLVILHSFNFNYEVASIAALSELESAAGE